MEAKSSSRILAAAAAAIVGLSAALLTGAPLTAALLALAGGAAAAALAWPAVEPEVAPPPPVEPTATPPLPSGSDVIAGLEEPLLIVRGRRVLLANPSAQALLGEHIEGVDVRLALRHPAAAERLTSGTDDENGVAHTEIDGIGERERRWDMAVSSLPGGDRLVRLTDRSDLHATEKMRGDFVANASHELRTPLATLLGFLETLQDEKAASDPKTRSRFITIMFDEARRMHRLVDDLISLSCIEAERFTTPRETVNMLPLVDEVRRSCGRMAEEKGSEIVIEIKMAELPLVIGDQMQLVQLIQNLVVNALKYGGDGAPVIVRFKEAGTDMLSMSVIDRGEGIAPEHLPRLTERFYRVDPGRSRSIGGTGLGLAIVKHIVSRHRGRLHIESRPGEGTRVQVHLPRAAEPLSSKCHENVTEDSP